MNKAWLIEDANFHIDEYDIGFSVPAGTEFEVLGIVSRDGIDVAVMGSFNGFVGKVHIDNVEWESDNDETN
jgi:hypothetical protein